MCPTPSPGRAERTREESRAPRLLVLRALGLGDLLTGVPALRALRHGLPHHRLVLAAPEALRPLVELAGVADELLPTGELEPVPWSGPPPDMAVDLHGNGPPSKEVLQRLRPRWLVAFAGPDAEGRMVDGPAWDPDEHETARWCRLVGHSLGVPVDPGCLGIARPAVPSPAPGAVVVHPGAASGSRRWPADRFAAVARWASAAGATVVLTGSAEERDLVDEVRRVGGLPPEADLAGRTDLAGLAALVADARLLVSGDTGIAHLATAYRTRSVVLFGPTPPSRWGPPADGPHDVVWHGTRVGDPHAAEVDPALLEVTVDEVVALAARRAGLPEEPAPAGSVSPRGPGSRAAAGAPAPAAP